MSAAVQASLRAATWLADRVLESAVVSEAGSCAIAVQVFGGTRVAFGTALIGGVRLGVLIGANGCCCGLGDRRPHRGAMARGRELAGAEERGEILYMITPDGDMYPHMLHTDAIQGAVRVLRGQRDRASVVGTAPAANAKSHGADWIPEPRELLEAVAAASARSFGEVGATLRRPTAPGEAGFDSDSAPIPPDWESVSNLPDPDSKGWYIIAGSDQSSSAKLPSLSVDFGVIGEGLGFVKVGNGSFLVQYGSPETALDARVLAIHESAGDGRHLGFREGAKQLTETSWPSWPLLGPRAAGWARRFIRDQDVAPRPRHARFEAEAGLSSSDPGVDFHDFCLRLLRIGIQFDQLNASEFAIFELICKKAQMIEYKYRDRHLHRMGAAGDDLAEDEHIYLGTSETRGLMMISPALSSYVADELHKSGGHDNSAGLQSRADKLASENKFLKEKLAAIDPKGKGKSGIEQMSTRILALGGPPCTAAAALTELCRSTPGYDCQPVKSIAYTEGRVSLPSDAVKCDASELLDGHLRELWRDWRQRLLRDPEQVREPIVPYFDEELRRSPRHYARFLSEMYKAGMIRFSSPRPSTAGLFFVEKPGNQLRMILDTRAVNQEFIDPDTTALPSAGVWRGLKIPASHDLSLSQVDIEAAFYRIGVPPGQDEMFVLPAVPVDALLEALPEVDIGSRLEGKVSPLLTALPMGWNWSFYFCQAPVASQVVAAGISANRIIQDRRVVPDVNETAGVAVYVDGATAIGRDPVSASATIEQAHQRLEASHLKCKGVQSDPWDQKFTGLNFDFETGRTSVSKGRIWPRRRRLWPEVGTECRVAAALIASAYLGTKLEVDPVVLATDASTGSGDLEGTGFGGYAVTEKTWIQHDVWAAAPCKERWRYKFEGAIEARRRALQAARELERGDEAREQTGVTDHVQDPEISDAVLPLESEGSTRTSSAAQPARCVLASVEHQVNFEEIDPSFLLPPDSWKLEVFGRWRRHEGRSSHYALKQTCRELAALSILTGSSVAVRWFPSELNSADKGSRAIGRPLSSHEGDCRHAGQLGADEARGLAASALARACGEAATWRGAGGARFLGEAEEREQPGRDLTAERAAQPNGDQEDPLGDASGVDHRLSLSSDSSSSSDTESSGTARHGDARGDVEPGLTFLQTNKVKPPTRTAFRERVRNFLEWANEGTLAEISIRRLDQLAANYMDVLFFDVMEVGEGSRLLAALQHLRPSLGTARHGNFPVARAAVAGFRRRARGGTRDPLCRPWVLAVVGVSLLLEDLEFATALWLAWGGMLRLPSDLVSMTPKTLIGTGRAAKPTRALLLYPSEEEARSKVMGADEGVILREACWGGGGSVAPTVVAYQVRHGAASHAAAVDQLPLSGITERLRHGNPHSSLRYAKHDRYLALLNRVPQAVVDWSETIHARLGGLLGGTDVLQAPAFLPQSVIEALRASCAKASNSGANKIVKFSSKLDSRRVR
ncbi:unnamed protein product [Prorocentrum cordatum]|uniref:Reverse transcriptase domain-containing protein n=1 Tax=Prorocentrum cordatum TaxID=2364126 RepID=A0ABN9Q8M7_9DINO|nr:unnamed protein product [Polarella glacialis]